MFKSEINIRSLKKNILVDKLLEVCIGSVLGALTILAFVHRAIYTRLKEGTRWRVRVRCDEFKGLVFTPVKDVVPHERWVAVAFANAESKLLADEKRTFFVRCV